MFIDYNRPQEEVVIDLIRRDNNNSPLSLLDVSFSEAMSITPTEDIPRNTSVLATSTAVGQYKGARQFFYNRNDINAIVEEWGITQDRLTLGLTNEIHVTDILPWLSSVMGIMITPQMVQSMLITYPSTPTQVIPYQVFLRPSNLTVIGTLTIWLKYKSA